MTAAFGQPPGGVAYEGEASGRYCDFGPLPGRAVRVREVGPATIIVAVEATEFRLERIADERYQATWGAGRAQARWQRRTSELRLDVEAGAACRMHALAAHVEPDGSSQENARPPFEALLVAQDQVDAGRWFDALATLEGALADLTRSGASPTDVHRMLLATRAALLIDVGESTAARALVDRAALDSAHTAGPLAQDFVLLVAGRDAAARGDRSRAWRLWQQSDAEQRRRLGVDPKERAEVLAALARGAQWVNASGAVDVAEQAVAYARERLAPDDWRTRLAELRLALALDGAGHRVASVALGEASYAQAVAGHGADSPIASMVLAQLASSLYSAGRLDAARVATERLLAYWQRAGSPRNDHRVDAAERLAFLIAESRRYGDAIALQEEVVPALAARFGEDDLRTWVARSNLAVWYRLVGREAEALARSRAAYAALAAKLGTHPLVASLERDLAYAELDAGDRTLACALFDRLAQAGEAHAPALELVRFDAMLGTGRCAIESGDVNGALRAFASAHAAIDARLGEDADWALDALAGLGYAQMRAGDRIAAAATLERLVDAVERGRETEAPQLAGGRARFADRVDGRPYLAGYRDLALLYAELGRREDAIRVAELARGRSFGDLLALRGGRRGTAPDREAVVRDRLAARLVALDAELAVTPLTHPAHADLAVERSGLQATLGKLAATPYPPARRSPADATASMPRDAVFVGIQFARGQAWLYTLRRDRRARVVTLGDARDIERALRALRELHGQPLPRVVDVWQRSDDDYALGLVAPEGDARRIGADRLAAHVARRVFGPIAPELRGARTLVVAADGPLAAFPVEVLLAPRLRADGLEVVYAASFAAWNASRDDGRASRTRAYDVVAIAAPDYSSLAPATRGPYSGLRWSSLPAAAREIRAIGDAFPSPRRLVVDAADATRAAFLRLASDGVFRRARIVHVAGHGFLSAAAPQWSAIVLRGEGADVDYLAAAELATLDLSSELVVLSACDTGRGRDVPGEGLFGLPYALGVAGARATLLSLWPVADDAAAVFMQRFYARLARGERPAAALARTKRDLMVDPVFGRPFFWAPFVLYGVG